MEKKPYNKLEYNKEFRKMELKEKKKAQFNTDIDYELKQELDFILKEIGISKAQFLRNAIEELKKKDTHPTE